MWFVLSLVALLCWSGADIFSKVGSKPDDKYSHLKMVCAVGLVMGLHALTEIIGGVRITWADIVTYLPVSMMYIVSMVMGYAAMRYIELSVSSPVCNSSGAVTSVCCFIFLGITPAPLQWVGVALASAGVIGLGVVEALEDDETRAMRQLQANVKYSKSFLALALPILYCIIDAAGTFFDSVILREEDTGTFLDQMFPTVLDEAVANVAYELTFLAMGVLCAVYLFGIKRERITVPKEAPKLAAAVCETAGQFAYIYALGDTSHAGFSVAIIACYSAVSALWGRIFLKEKLSWKHYAALAAVFVGIVIMGIFDA